MHGGEQAILATLPGNHPDKPTRWARGRERVSRRLRPGYWDLRDRLDEAHENYVAIAWMIFPQAAAALDIAQSNRRRLDTLAVRSDSEHIRETVTVLAELKAKVVAHERQDAEIHEFMDAMRSALLDHAKR